MISLYGIREEHEYGYGGWTGNRKTIRELVATFDEVQDAKDYVKNSTLAAADKPYFRAEPISGKYRYRKGSLLRYYESCEIDIEEEESPPPHNPVMPNNEDTTKWYNCPRCDAGYPNQECVCKESEEWRDPWWFKEPTPPPVQQNKLHGCELCGNLTCRGTCFK